jgi:hypothetical protein
MSDTILPVSAHSASLLGVRYGAFHFSSGYSDPAFLTSIFNAVNASVSIPESFSRTYTSFLPAVDFYSATEMTMEAIFTRVDAVYSTNRIIWDLENEAGHAIHYDFSASGLSIFMSPNLIPINPFNIGAAHEFVDGGWTFSRGLWRFDVWCDIHPDAAIYNASQSRYLVALAHRNYSTGFNRQQTLGTPTTTGPSFQFIWEEWLNVDPLWNCFFNTGIDTTVGLGSIPFGAEYVHVTIYANRLSPILPP